MLRWVKVLRRHLWAMAITFVTMFVVVAGLLLTLPKAYTSTAQVQVVMHQRNSADVTQKEESGDSALSDSSRIETEVNILQSHGLARVVMHAVGPEPAKPHVSLGVGHLLKSLLPKSAPKPQDPKVAESAAVDAFSKGLKVSRADESYVIDIAYTADDPEWAAKVANTFIRSYQDLKMRGKLDNIDEVNSYLTATLANLESQVTQADSAVARYKAMHNLEQAGASTITEQDISLIQQQLEPAKAQQTEAEARYQTALAQLASGGKGGDIGDALASPVISALRQQRAEESQTLTDLRARYGGKHPDVQKASQQVADSDAQIQGEVQRIVSNLKAQANVARERAGALEASLSRANSQLATNENASVELSDLLRKQEAARTSYQEYLDRYKQTSSQQDLPQNEVRVVTLASPSSKASSLDPIKALALSLAASSICALASLAVAEFFQKGFLDAEDVQQRLGVRALPNIPELSSTVPGRTDWAAATEYVVQRPLSIFTEAFRTLRTSVLASRTGAAVQVVAITSALPGEGKTTTSVCFGRVAALGHVRTVIVDCDLRRRSLDGVIGRRMMIGMLDVLAGRASLDEALLRDESSESYLLPLGGDDDIPHGIFNTAAMDELLADLRRRFELVILDTAPILALADAREISRKVDALVLLVRWRKTPRRAVEDAVRELDDVGGRLVGISLTQVDVSQTSTIAYARASHQYFRHA